MNHARLDALASFSLLVCGLPATPVLVTAQGPASPQYPALPSELPAAISVPDASHNYARRVVMIPMRDGSG
jgi:hypothetical protein